MVVKSGNHFGDDDLLGLVARVNNDVGLGIKRVALVHQATHDPFGIVIVQERPVGAAADAFHQGRQVGLQPDRDAAARDGPPCLRAHERTAAGGDDTRPAFKQTRDHPTLQRAEFALSIGREQVRHRHARNGLDLVIAVDEWQLQCIGHTPANHRLAGTHQADEHKRAPAKPVGEIFDIWNG